MNRQFLAYQQAPYHNAANIKDNNHSNHEYINVHPHHQVTKQHYQPNNHIIPTHEHKYEENAYQIHHPSHLVNYQTQIMKEPSHKRLPIIYQNPGKPPLKIQTKVLSQAPYNYKDEQHHNYQQHSNNYPYKQPKAQTESSENVFFQTFQNLPVESEAQTAKFINSSQKHISQDPYQYTSMRRQDPKPQYINHNQYQMQHSRSNNAIFTHNTMNNNLPHDTVISNFYEFPLGINSSHRKYEQIPQKVTNSSQFIQISKEQYENLVFNRSQLQKRQSQKNELKMKCQQLSKSKIFYYEQNNSLRHQIQRLHGIVQQSDQRQKHLIDQNRHLQNNINDLVPKYRQSVLQEIALLLQRYKLEQKRNN